MALKRWQTSLLSGPGVPGLPYSPSGAHPRQARLRDQRRVPRIPGTDLAGLLG